MRDARLEGRSIILRQEPKKDVLGGIRLEFSASNRWLRENKHLNPVMTTDIIEGQTIYTLPKYFRVKSIKKIFVSGEVLSI